MTILDTSKMQHFLALFLTTSLLLNFDRGVSAFSSVTPPSNNKNGMTMGLLSPNSGSSGAGKVVKPFGGGGGGRKPMKADMPSLKEEEDANDDDADADAEWQPSPLKPSEARLTVVQITDVYTLENFAALKTMLVETRGQIKEFRDNVSGAEGGDTSTTADNSDEKLPQTLTKSDTGVISMLTGDFLAPYLLSSVDRGKGMMRALAGTPIDYLTWGNHEADIDHRTVCRHVRDFNGKWINSNMLDHDAMDAQQEFDVVEITSPDGTNTRRVGLVGVLSNDPDLYSHFKAPGAFGGATIDDPWETLRKYEDILKGPEHNCDCVLPLQHLYAPQDHKTCEDFDFPVILSGHDHHRVDEVVGGTRLLKPGLDGIYATVMEMIWEDSEHMDSKPKIKARFVKTSNWEADPVLDEINLKAYAALAPLRDTELARVPPTFEPLSSVNSRGRVCSMGRFICSLLKSSLNTAEGKREHKVDAVLLMGGNIRGGTDYEKGSYFSLEALEAEVKPDEAVGIVLMPGWLLAEGIAATHAGDPIPGWIQHDDGVKEEYPEDGGPPIVTHVNGLAIEHDLTYRVATKISDLTNGQSQPWTDFYTENPEALPTKGAYVNIYAELMAFFAGNLWRKIWEAITPQVVAEERGQLLEEFDSPLDVMCDRGPEMEPDMDCKPIEMICDPELDCLPERRLSVLDLENTGTITVDDIHAALSDILQLSVDESGEETTLAEFVHSFADSDSDGKVTLADMYAFCDEVPALFANEKWRLAFPRTEKLLA